MSMMQVRNDGPFSASIPGYSISPGETKPIPAGFETFVTSRPTLVIVSASDAIMARFCAKRGTVTQTPGRVPHVPPAFPVSTWEEIVPEANGDPLRVSWSSPDDHNREVVFSRLPAECQSPLTIVVLTMLKDPVQLPVTDHCIGSILKYTTCPFSLVIVDNASTLPAWANKLQALAVDSRVTVLRQTENTGVAGGRNIGAAACQTDYIAFLDDDVYVSAGWNEYLEAALRLCPGAAIAGGVAGSHCDTFMQGHRLDWGNPYPYVGGGCTIVSREAFEKEGGFDAGLFNPYWGEDADLCWRLQMDLKAKVVHVKNEIATHVAHNTTRHITREEREASAGRSYHNLVNRWKDRISPSLTVVMPFKTHVQFAAEAIASCAELSLPWDLVVVADTDEAYQQASNLVSSAVPTNCENSVVLMSDVPGLSGARNTGWRNATSYVCFLDTDDRLLPGIQDGIEFMRRRVDVDAVFGDVVLGEAGKPDRLHQYGEINWDDALRENVVPMGGTVIRADVLQRFGGFNGAMTCAEDWWYWLMLMCRGGRMAYLPTQMAWLRQHKDQMTRVLEQGTAAIKDRIPSLLPSLQPTGEISLLLWPDGFAFEDTDGMGFRNSAEECARATKADVTLHMVGGTFTPAADAIRDIATVMAANPSLTHVRFPLVGSHWTADEKIALCQGLTEVVPPPYLEAERRGKKLKRGTQPTAGIPISGDFL